MHYGRHSDAKRSITRHRDAGDDTREREIVENVAARLLPQQRTRAIVERELDEARTKVLRLEQELKTPSSQPWSCRCPQGPYR